MPGHRKVRKLLYSRIHALPSAAWLPQDTTAKSAAKGEQYRYGAEIDPTEQFLPLPERVCPAAAADSCPHQIDKQRGSGRPVAGSRESLLRSACKLDNQAKGDRLVKGY